MNRGADRQRQIKPGQGYDPKSKNITIEANLKIVKLSRTRQLGKVLSCYETYKLNSEFRPTLVTFNVLIGACVKCGDLTKACEFFADLKKRSKKDDRFRPDIISFTTLLKGFCCAGWMVAASKLLDQMTSTEVQLNPNIRTVSMFLRGCLWTGDVHRTIALLARMRGWWLQLDSISLEYAVRVLAMSIHLPEAEAAIREFCDQALKRNEKTMASYIKGGGAGAKGAFRGVSPTTYLSLASAHAALGEWREALRDSRTAEFAAIAAEEAAIIRAKATVKKVEEEKKKTDRRHASDRDSNKRDKHQNADEDEAVDSEDEEEWRAFGYTSLHQFLVAKNGQLKEDAKALQLFCARMIDLDPRKFNTAGTHPSWVVVAEETSAAAAPGERAVDRKELQTTITSTGQTQKISKPIAVTGSTQAARKFHMVFDSDEEGEGKGTSLTLACAAKESDKKKKSCKNSSSDSDSDSESSSSEDETVEMPSSNKQSLSVSFESLLKRTLLFPPVIGQDDVHSSPSDPHHHFISLLANRVITSLGGEAILRAKNKHLAIENTMSEQQEEALLTTEKNAFREHFSLLFPAGSSQLDPSQLFPKRQSNSQRPLFLEACAGWGEWIAQRAFESPEADFIACELRHDRCHQILMRSYIKQLENLSIVRGDMRLFMSQYAPQNGWLDGAFLLFPEPPGRRDSELEDPFFAQGDHLTGEKSLTLLLSALKGNCELIICTDDASLSRQVAGLVQTRLGHLCELMAAGDAEVSKKSASDTVSQHKLLDSPVSSFFDKLWKSRQKSQRFIVRVRRLQSGESIKHTPANSLKILKKAQQAITEAVEEASKRFAPLIDRWQKQKEKREAKGVEPAHRRSEQEHTDAAQKRKFNSIREDDENRNNRSSLKKIDQNNFSVPDAKRPRENENKSSNLKRVEKAGGESKREESSSKAAFDDNRAKQTDKKRSVEPPSQAVVPPVRAQINHMSAAIIPGAKGARMVFDSDSDS